MFFHYVRDITDGEEDEFTSDGDASVDDEDGVTVGGAEDLASPVQKDGAQASRMPHYLALPLTTSTNSLISYFSIRKVHIAAPKFVRKRES